MRHPARSRWMLMALGAAVVAPAIGFTYALLDPPRHWNQVPVHICVIGPGHKSVTANDPDGGLTATIQALNGTHPLLAGTGWNATAAGQIVSAEQCASGWSLGDGVPTIALDEKLSGTCAGSCLAATFIGYYQCDQPFPDGHCEIFDADVETRRNKADRWGGPYYSLYEPCRQGKEWNLEAIMVHEAGHQLGLGHSDVVGATMYPSVGSCNADPATIAGDDAAGLDQLY